MAEDINTIEEIKEMSQGKRKDQTEFSMMMVFGGLVGIIMILLFSLVTCVAMEVWSSLCG